MNPLPIAFGPFSSSAMLWWGLAAGIPLLLHLWQRRQQRRIDWAAMRFLMAALAKHQRRIQLWQWLLLAVRIAALLALAVALAGPVLRTSVTNPIRTPRLNLIAIDASASMQAEVDGRTAWSQAIQSAVQRCRNGAPGDGWMLWSLGPRVVRLIDQPSYDVESVVQQLENLEPTDGMFDLAAALAALQDGLAQASQQAPQLIDRHVLMFSDLQVGSWQSVSESRTARLLDGLQAQCHWELIDVSLGRETPNAGIVDLRLESDLPLAGSFATIEARMKNWSGTPIAKREAELMVDGQVRQSSEVNVAAGGEAAVRWTEPLPTDAGTHEIGVRWSTDALASDDQRWLITETRAALRVWCLGPTPESTRYVATALKPDDESEAAIELMTGDLRDLQQLQPGAVDVLVLCDLPELTAVEVQRIESLSDTGTGVMWFLGSRTKPADFNRELAGSPIFPFRIGESPAPAMRRPIDPLDYRHPLVAPFAQHPGAGLLSTPVFTVWPVEPTTPDTEVVLRAGELPLIVTRFAGDARVVIVLTDPTPQALDRRADPPLPWTALPAWPSFVPLMQTALRLLVQPMEPAGSNDVGALLSGVLSMGAGTATAELALPDGQRRGLTLAMRDSGREASWTFGEADRAGVYRVQSNQGQRLAMRALNTPTVEGELRTIDAALVPSGPRAPAAEPPTSEQTVDRFGPGLSGYSLVPYCLLTVLGLLFAESSLSARLGRRWR